MVSEPLPSSYDSSIEFIDMSTQYLTTDPITVNVRLSGADYYQDQDIVLFDNNTRVGTVKTDVNGNATFTIENVSEGKHTLLARFNGTDHLSSAEVTMDTSAGVIYRFVEYPSYSINRQGFSVKLTANDYLGEPIQKKLDVYIGGYYRGNWVGMGMGYCENGVANINVEYPDLEEVTSRIVSGLDDGDTGIAGSQEITVTPYENVTISLNQPSTSVGYGKSLTLTGQVSNVSESVTVSLNQGLGTVKTDTNGNFSVTYNGTGAGDVTVTASIGNVSSSVTFEDLWQYWKAPSTIINRDYRLHNANLTNLSNGFRLSSSSISESALIFDIYPSTLIEFTVVSIDSLALAFYPDDYSSAFTVPNVKAGAKIKIIVNQDSGSVYMDDVYVTTAQVSNDTIRFGVLGTGKYMLFDNLKIKRT